MARQHHKQMRVRGQPSPSAAKLATDTGSTVEGRIKYQAQASTAAVGDHNYEMVPVPPASREDDDARPVTLGHIRSGRVIVGIVISLSLAIATGAWWLSQSSSKIEQHGEKLKDISSKTDRLLNDSVVASTKLQNLESRATKLEDAVFVTQKSNKR